MPPSQRHADVKQLCFSVPNAHKLSGISVDYYGGRGTQPLDVAIFAGPVLIIVVAMLVYGLRVRQLTAGRKGPLT